MLTGTCKQVSINEQHDKNPFVVGSRSGIFLVYSISKPPDGHAMTDVLLALKKQEDHRMKSKEVENDKLKNPAICSFLSSLKISVCII
jgi:hypothetical protein